VVYSYRKREITKYKELVKHAVELAKTVEETERAKDLHNYIEIRR